MSGLLADLYSTIDSKKRQLAGLLADPVETLKLGLLNFKNDQNALLDTQAQAYPFIPRTKDQQARIPTFARTQEQARKELADQGANMGIAAATVWHGSPHKFDKFDSSKIGTGEGAQAYGHGLYLAESPDVAKQYAENVRAPDRRGLDPAYVAAAKDFLQNGMDPVEWLPKAYKNIKPKDIPLAVGEAKNAFAPSVYKVDLPDEAIAKMLDWDKPLSQQHHDVQSAAKNLGIHDAANGEDLLWKIKRTKYDAMEAMRGNTGLSGAGKFATEQLKGQGIPGIRYLDGGSRGAGSGTSNYVIFPGNEDLLTILERNGQGLLGQ